MRKLIIALSLLSAPACAKDITVTFTEEELKVQMALNEVALKTAGEQAVDAYTVLRNKYREAAKPVEAAAPKKEAAPK